MVHVPVHVYPLWIFQCTVGILISFLKVIIDTICKIYNNISNYRVLFCPVKHRVLIKTSYQKMINKPIEKEQTNTEK